MSTLSIDFETRSTVDLKASGVYPYAEHPHTDIWCMAWAFDDDEPEIWTPGDTGAHRFDCPYGDGECECPVGLIPERVQAHIAAGGEIRAWNAQFERVIWQEIMVKRYGAPAVALEQWVCSAAEAAAMALPRALEQAAQVLGVQQQKDSEGYSLMLRMSRPRKLLEDGTPVWWDVEDRKQRLFDYCKQDVRTERAIVKALRRLTPKEREVYLLDQRINDRGVRIDRELVTAAMDVAAEGVKRANAEMHALTGGQVSEVTNHGRLRQWLVAQGVETDSVGKAAVREMLEQDLAPAVRQVLETRADAGRSSLAKLDSMLAVACADDRARGLLLYHGAGTGRWTGRLLQPQNFPRGEVDDIESFIPDVLARDYDGIDLIRHPIVVLSGMLRSMLTANPGHELIAGDFSAIEARVLNWLAGQDDVVESFRSYDLAPKDEKAKYDPYRRMAVRMGRGATPESVSKDDRQAGKAAELGCGYQMGATKFVTAAWQVYQVRVNEAEARSAVEIYRASHNHVVDFWYATERACLAAISNPGQVQTFGALKNLKAVKAGAYLYLVLPSGRPLCYAAPRVVDAPTPWGDTKPQMEYSGVDSYSRRWGRLRAYGGLLVENVVQAVSRDLMAEAMLRLEAAGYPPVLSVHDEVVAEVPEGVGSVKEFERLLAELPAWAHGCPVAAEGWRGARYRK